MPSYSTELVEPTPIDDPVSLFQEESIKKPLASDSPFSAVRPSLPLEASSATLVAELDISQQLQKKDVSLPAIDFSATNNVSYNSEERKDSAVSQLESLKQLDGLQLLVECAVAQIEQTQKPATNLINDQGQRHGISRYAPYGTRFGATMKDGAFRTSHVAGDLANRARIKNGRGARVDLILVPHEGEMKQLESAWGYCEKAIGQGYIRPGPSEVLNHLREENIDFDYRKPDGFRLLQRNASNFYKRMMEYGKKLSSPIQTSKPSLMDIDLSQFTKDFEGFDSCPVPVTPKTYEKYPTSDIDEEDYELEEEDEEEIEQYDNHKKRKYAGDHGWVEKKPRIGLSNKGLSRHSPYGTRFSAEMEDGTVKESFLAGDLTDRARIKGSRNKAELKLVLHSGEIKQLECAWEFILSSPVMPGAASVLDYLRQNNLNENHRKPGTFLLQKNAGNFFKRVQEFGKRRQFDANYLRETPQSF